MVHVLHAHVEGARNPYVGRDVGIPRSSSSLASSSRPRRAATFLQQCSTRAPNDANTGQEAARFDIFAMCDCIIYIDLAGKVTTRI